MKPTRLYGVFLRSLILFTSLLPFLSYLFVILTCRERDTMIRVIGIWCRLNL